MAFLRNGEESGVAKTRGICLGVEEGGGCSASKNGRWSRTAEGSECPVKE